jgi:hypothetical protein
MSNEVQRVEVNTSVQRRRRWSVAEKIRLELASSKGRNFNPPTLRSDGGNSRNDLCTIWLGLDQGRSELRSSEIKGRNPFADKRVRQAIIRQLTSRRSAGT